MWSKKSISLCLLIGCLCLFLHHAAALSSEMLIASQQAQFWLDLNKFLLGERLIVERMYEKQEQPATEQSVILPLVEVVETTSEVEPVIHTVEKGDTLSEIAYRYDLAVRELVRYNDLNDAHTIYPGQVLNLKPGMLSYTIKKNDSYWSISRQYQVSIEDLQEANPGINPNNLQIGQEISIPVTSETTFVIDQGYSWPLSGPITSGFGMRNGSLHRGIDIAAPYYTEIKAARGGTVTLAGWAGNYGNCLIITHQDGWQTRYAHAAKLLVDKNQTVKAGQSIALVGSTGNSTGPHLHFEIISPTGVVNPLPYLPDN